MSRFISITTIVLVLLSLSFANISASDCAEFSCPGAEYTQCCSTMDRTQFCCNSSEWDIFIVNPPATPPPFRRPPHMDFAPEIFENVQEAVEDALRAVYDPLICFRNALEEQFNMEQTTDGRPCNLDKELTIVGDAMEAAERQLNHVQLLNDQILFNPQSLASIEKSLQAAKNTLKAVHDALGTVGSSPSAITEAVERVQNSLQSVDDALAAVPGAPKAAQPALFAAKYAREPLNKTLHVVRVAKAREDEKNEQTTDIVDPTESHLKMDLLNSTNVDNCAGKQMSYVQVIIIVVSACVTVTVICVFVFWLWIIITYNYMLNNFSYN